MKTSGFFFDAFCIVLMFIGIGLILCSDNYSFNGRVICILLHVFVIIFFIIDLISNIVLLMIKEIDEKINAFIEIYQKNETDNVSFQKKNFDHVIQEINEKNK